VACGWQGVVHVDTATTVRTVTALLEPAQD